MRVRYLVVVLTVVALGQGNALELSAGADTINASQVGINAKLDASNALLTSAINTLTNRIKVCSAKQALYNPGGVGADADGCVAITSGGSLAVTTVQANGSAYRWPAASANCPSDTNLVGGGAYCVRPSGATSTLMDSEPNGNGWSAYCAIDQHMNGSIKVYALCAKVQ